MKRFHHLRTNQQVRDSAAEVSLSAEQFILPLFIVEGRKMQNEIPSMPGVFHYSADMAKRQIEKSLEKGIRKHLLFGVVDAAQKDEQGTSAYSPNNLISNAIREIKSSFGTDVILFTDVCLCGYTNHGHCGLVEAGRVENDNSLPFIAAMALAHASAGADFVAPSAMMDGQVEAIRGMLDQNGLHQVKIMAYSAKYASAFYGPFRDAVQSAPAFGDRRSYQIDYRTIGQGVDEAAVDLEEGADWIMVKPAHGYLDMIQRIKSRFQNAILAAYHVSGEYMLLKTAARLGLMNELTAFTEVTTSIRRAGADFVITYYAHELADSLRLNIIKHESN